LKNFRHDVIHLLANARNQLARLQGLQQNAPRYGGAGQVRGNQPL